jgi:hypothetical protein
MSKSYDSHMNVVLAQRFAPFNFSTVSGYQNSVPHVDEWKECLPKFKEYKDDSHAKHLVGLHEHIHQMNIHQEYV